MITPEELRILADQLAEGDVPGAANALRAAADEIETLTGFLELLDISGVTMNGMKPTEALEKLRKIAA